MAYEPTNWKTGDVVTSAKLNKLENAVANGGGILVVHDNISDNGRTLDKTWQELFDAMSSGILCVIFGNYELTAMSSMITNLYKDQEEYSVDCGESTYRVDSPNGYPVYRIN